MNWLVFFINLSFLAIAVLIVLIIRMLKLHNSVNLAINNEHKTKLQLDEMEELLHQEDRFFYVHDFAGKIEYISRGVDDCLGFHAEKLIGENFRSLMVNKQSNNWETYINRIFQSGEIRNTFWLLSNKGESVQYAYCSKTVLEDGVITRVKGSVKKFNPASLPATKKEKVLDLEYCLGSEGLHDLNNIFSAILGFSDVIQNDNLKIAEMKKYNLEIADAGQQGVDIIKKYLSSEQKNKKTVIKEKGNSKPDVKSKDDSQTQNTKKIVYVDDEKSLLKMYTTFIQRQGYAVESFNNGVEAVEYITDNLNEVGLLLLDWMMPEMSGENVLASIREQNISIPVIILSGKKIEIDHLPEVKSVLEKPVNPEKMTEVISQSILK